MLKKVMLAALMTAPLFAAAPALAQNAAQNGVLIVYGQDKCPTNKDGEEIVVCRRLDESERYRIPKDVRTDTVDPKYDAWAVKSEANAAVGATGAGSCSTVGAGGGTGCFVQQATQAKRERKAARKEAENLPLP